MRHLILFFAVLPLVADAYETKLSGFIGGELRYFVSDAQFENQFNGLQASLLLQPEVQLQADKGNNQFSFIPFIRLDSRDDRRTHGDLREAYWRHIDDQWELLIGVNRVFWGVAESNHLVDIINQTDEVEDIDREDKLGQPMINLSAQQGWGKLSLFILPWFRERTFPSKDGRLRSQPSVERDVMYESTAEQGHVDFALRYSHYLGDWDLGLYYFTGTGREPRFLLNESGAGLIALYDQIDQLGSDIQFTHGAWLWKFEGIVRSQNEDEFSATVGGFEYTFYQINDSAADLGVLLEYSHDTRDEDPAKAPPVIFDDDIFLAARLAVNDTQDSMLLAGISIDRNDHSSVLSIEAERRFGSRWSVELESRWFMNIKEETLLASLKKDSYVGLKLLRYF